MHHSAKTVTNEQDTNPPETSGTIERRVCFDRLEEYTVALYRGAKQVIGNLDLANVGS
jgi:hypothetical protein